MYADWGQRRKLNLSPRKQPVCILVTSGASCPDALVEDVIKNWLFYDAADGLDTITASFIA